MVPGHPLNWCFGWCLIVSGFVTGATIGLFFHQEKFLGGYTSFRRRIIRLGHIAQVALGMMNVLYGLAPAAAALPLSGASICFMAGGVAMPLVCFLSGWNALFRYIFFVPVALLIMAVIFTLQEGLP